MGLDSNAALRPISTFAPSKKNGYLVLPSTDNQFVGSAGRAPSGKSTSDSIPLVCYAMHELRLSDVRLSGMK
jgi:hypothetical protein